MPTRRIKKRIHEIRQEPEHIRLRAASTLTAIAGVILVIVWVGILLPLQIRFNRDSADEEAQEGSQLDELPEIPGIGSFEGTGNVGGLQDIITPAPALTTPFVGSPTPSPTPESLPSAAPVATAEPAPTLSPAPGQP